MSDLYNASVLQPDRLRAYAHRVARDVLAAGTPKPLRYLLTEPVTERRKFLGMSVGSRERTTPVDYWLLDSVVDESRLWITKISPHPVWRNTIEGGTYAMLRIDGQILLAFFKRYRQDNSDKELELRNLREASDTDLCALDRRQAGHIDEVKHRGANETYREELKNRLVLNVDKKGLGMSLALKRLHQQAGY